jgi:hypothetical protein
MGRLERERKEDVRPRGMRTCEISSPLCFFPFFFSTDGASDGIPSSAGRHGVRFLNLFFFFSTLMTYDTSPLLLSKSLEQEEGGRQTGRQASRQAVDKDVDEDVDMGVDGLFRLILI